MQKLAVGDKAPEFQLACSDGTVFDLGKAAGKWLVLYFYPKDDTPGCTKEACNFRDMSGDYRQANALIYGVSADTLASHQKFIQKYQLPFPLLSDPEHGMLTAYGVWKEKSMYGRNFLGIERSTYVIAPDGRIAAIFPKVKVDNHHREVLDFIIANS